MEEEKGRDEGAGSDEQGLANAEVKKGYKNGQTTFRDKLKLKPDL